LDAPALSEHHSPEDIARAFLADAANGACPAAFVITIPTTEACP